MANKSKDHRTIDQYIKILKEDGVDPHKAQRVAARRYTPYGLSYDLQMRSIFPNSEAIFGFNSGAPLGYRIAPGLDKYLQSRNSGLTREDSFSHYLKPYGMMMTAGNKSTLCDQKDSALQYLKKTLILKIIFRKIQLWYL